MAWEVLVESAVAIMMIGQPEQGNKHCNEKLIEPAFLCYEYIENYGAMHRGVLAFSIQSTNKTK